MNRCVKKWSTFPKSELKSGVLFQKVGQKVTHPSEKVQDTSNQVCQNVAHFFEK